MEELGGGGLTGPWAVSQLVLVLLQLYLLPFVLIQPSDTIIPPLYL